MSGTSSRKMIYPYTLTAKIAHFPFKFYYDNSRFFKSYVIAFFVCMPFFYKMQKLTCSEANYANLEAYRKKEREEFEHHKDHML